MNKAFYYIPPVFVYDVGRRFLWNSSQSFLDAPMYCKWSALVSDDKASVDEYPTGPVVKFQTDQQLRDAGMWK